MIQDGTLWPKLLISVQCTLLCNIFFPVQPLMLMLKCVGNLNISKKVLLLSTSYFKNYLGDTHLETLPENLLSGFNHLKTNILFYFYWLIIRRFMIYDLSAFSKWLKPCEWEESGRRIRNDLITSRKRAMDICISGHFGGYQSLQLEDTS